MDSTRGHYLADELDSVTKNRRIDQEGESQCAKCLLPCLNTTKSIKNMQANSEFFCHHLFELLQTDKAVVVINRQAETSVNPTVSQ